MCNAFEILKNPLSFINLQSPTFGLYYTNTYKHTVLNINQLGT